MIYFMQQWEKKQWQSYIEIATISIDLTDLNAQMMLKNAQNAQYAQKLNAQKLSAIGHNIVNILFLLQHVQNKLVSERITCKSMSITKNSRDIFLGYSLQSLFALHVAYR